MHFYGIASRIDHENRCYNIQSNENRVRSLEKLVHSAIVCSMNGIKIKELHTCSKGVFREIITNYGNHDGREDVDSKYR